MAFISELKKHKLAFFKTSTLYASFIMIGLTSAIAGPTILDLQLATGVAYDKITLILPGRSGGYALGSLTSKCGV